MRRSFWLLECFAQSSNGWHNPLWHLFILIHMQPAIFSLFSFRTRRLCGTAPVRSFIDPGPGFTWCCGRRPRNVIPVSCRCPAGCGGCIECGADVSIYFLVNTRRNWWSRSNGRQIQTLLQPMLASALSGSVTSRLAATSGKFTSRTPNSRTHSLLRFLPPASDCSPCSLTARVAMPPTAPVQWEALRSMLATGS